MAIFTYLFVPLELKEFSVQPPGFGALGGAGFGAGAGSGTTGAGCTDGGGLGTDSMRESEMPLQGRKYGENSIIKANCKK